MVKTKICKGDKVVLVRGRGAGMLDEITKKRVICTVLKVDREKGRATVEMPHPKQKRGEKPVPLPGVEQWKTARYNPKTGEAGGLKIVKRAVHVSNMMVVEPAPRRNFGATEE